MGEADCPGALVIASARLVAHHCGNDGALLAAGSAAWRRPNTTEAGTSMATNNSTNIRPSTAPLTQLKPTQMRIWSSCSAEKGCPAGCSAQSKMCGTRYR